MDTDVDATPSRVGRYDIVLPLAAGETGPVYLARPFDGKMGDGKMGDAASGEPYFALKLLARGPSRDAATKRVLAAARSRRHLRHPNVVSIVEVGDTESGAFVLMEYIPGETLAGLRRLASESRSELPRPVALKVLVDALVGLHAVHDLAGEDGRPLALLHNGLTARKILVGTDGLARLPDFAATSSGAKSSGAHGHVAPELREGTSATADRRADVFAAGAIAWEILTGRSLDADPSSFVAPSSLAPGVGPELDDVVRRALAPDPALRPATAVALARELESAARAASMFTDTSEVAEHVTRLVGPELVERRELLEDARKQRRRQLSAPDVRTMIGLAGPLPVKRAPLPSLPDLPPPPTDLRSELRIEVNLARPVERATLDVLGPAPPPPPEEPEVFRSPLAIGDEPVGPAVSATPLLAPPDAPEVPAGVPSSTRPVERVREVVRPWLSPPWTTKKISTLTGLGGGLLGFLLVLVALTARSKPTDSSTASASAGSASVAAPEIPSPAPTESSFTASVTPTATATATADDDASILQVRANAPIASVKVDGRLIDAVVATPTLNVDLEPAERDRPLRIVATAKDGRTVTATAQPGSRELEVTFGAKPRPRPAPASTTKRTWPKRSPR